MSRRCTGHCCRRFFLPHSHVEYIRALWAVLHAEADDPESGRWFDDDGDERPERYDELERIVPMLVPLGPWHYNAESYGLGETEESGYAYTCRNLLSNGDCGIYARRPAMCSEFPYGRPCRFVLCTSDVALRLLPDAS